MQPWASLRDYSRMRLRKILHGHPLVRKANEVRRSSGSMQWCECLAQCTLQHRGATSTDHRKRLPYPTLCSLVTSPRRSSWARWKELCLLANLQLRSLSTGESPPEDHHSRAVAVVCSGTLNCRCPPGTMRTRHVSQLTADMNSFPRASTSICYFLLRRFAGVPTQGIKPIQEDITQGAVGAVQREPIGVRGRYPIAFGGGQQGVGQVSSHP